MHSLVFGFFSALKDLSWSLGFTTVPAVCIDPAIFCQTSGCVLFQKSITAPGSSAELLTGLGGLFAILYELQVRETRFLSICCALLFVQATQLSLSLLHHCGLGLSAGCPQVPLSPPLELCLHQPVWLWSPSRSSPSQQHSRSGSALLPARTRPAPFLQPLGKAGRGKRPFPDVLHSCHKRPTSLTKARGSLAQPGAITWKF